MANKKISQETLRATLDGTESLRFALDGANYRAPASAIAALVTRASLGLATTDSPTFAGATFNGATVVHDTVSENTEPAFLINQNTYETPPPTVHSGLQIVGADNNYPAIYLDAFGAGFRSIINLRTARGTAEVPTASAKFDELGRVAGRGYYGGEGERFGGSAAAISFLAAQNFNSSAEQGGWFVVRTTPLNAVAGGTFTDPPIRLSVMPSGTQAIGTQAFALDLTNDFGTGWIAAQSGLVTQRLYQTAGYATLTLGASGALIGSSTNTGNQTVASTTGLPATSTARPAVLINRSEAVTFTVVDATTINVIARGRYGTTATATHANGEIAQLVSTMVVGSDTQAPAVAITTGGIGVGGFTSPTIAASATPIALFGSAAAGGVRQTITNADATGWSEISFQGSSIIVRGNGSSAPASSALTQPSTGVLSTIASGGLMIGATNAAGAISFLTGSAALTSRRGKIASDGGWLIGASTFNDGASPGSGSVSIQNHLIVGGAQVTMAALPTSNPSVAGRLWNDGGTLKVSAG